MRAWYFDNKPGHQKLAHMGEHVPNEVVYKLGIKHWKIPLEGHEKVIDEIAKERDYPNRDVINISKEGLGKVRGVYSRKGRDSRDPRIDV
jgi:1,2-dihydroxy-3-keto-5-methylthiopentene dioxygenase